MSTRDAVLNIKVKDGASAPLDQIEAALAAARGAVGAFANGLRSLDAPLSGASKGYRNLLDSYRNGGSGAIRSAELAQRRLADNIRLTETAARQAETRTASLKQRHADLAVQLNGATAAIVEMHRRMREAPKGSPERERFADLEKAARGARSAIVREMTGLNKQFGRGVADVSRLSAELDALKQRASIAAGLMKGLRFSPDLSAFGAAQARVDHIRASYTVLSDEMRKAVGVADRLQHAMRGGSGSAQMREELDQVRGRIRAMREEQRALIGERGELAKALARPLRDAAAGLRGDKRAFGGQIGGYSLSQLNTMGIRAQAGDIDRELADIQRMISSRLQAAVRGAADVAAAVSRNRYGSDAIRSAREGAVKIISDQDIARAQAATDRFAGAMSSARERVAALKAEGDKLTAGYDRMTAAVQAQQAAVGRADTKHRNSGLQADLDALDRQKAKLAELIGLRAKHAESINRVIGRLAQEEANTRKIQDAFATASFSLNAMREQADRFRLDPILNHAGKARAEFASLQAQLEKARAALSAMGAMPAGRVRNAAMATTAQEVQTLEARLNALKAGSPYLRDITSRQAIAQLLRMTVGLDQIRSASNRAAGGIGRLSKAFNIFGTDARTALSLAQRVRGQLLSMAAAYVGVFAAVQQASNVVQTFRDLEAAGARLNYVFDGNMDRAAREMRYLREQADHFGLSLKQMTTDYTKFAAAATGAGLNNDGIRKIFEGVSAAARVNKLNTEQVQRVYTALGQSISKNQVYSEELKGQLAESLPGAVTLFARAMGYGTDEMTKFNKALADGKFDSASVVRFGEYLSETFSGSLADVSGSFEARLNRFLNSIFDARTIVANGGFMEGLSQAMANLEEFFESDSGREYFHRIGQGAGMVFKAVSELAKHIDTILAVAFAAFGMKAISILTGVLAGVRASLMGTTAAAGPLRVALDGAAAAASRASASIATLSGVQRVAASTGLRLSQTVYVLRGAFVGLMSALGGPIGLLFVAGTAAAAWWTSKSAKKSAEASAAFEKVSDSINRVKDSISESQGSLEKYLKTLDGVGETEARLEAAAARKQAVSGVNSVLTDIAKGRLDAVSVPGQDTMLGRYVNLDSLGERGDLAKRIAAGQDYLHNKLTRLVTDYERGAIAAEEFNGQVESLGESGLLDANQVASIQKAGRAYVDASRGARIMEIRARMLTATGEEQAKLYSELIRLTADQADALEAVGGEYGKLNDLMAAIGGNASEFKEAIDATGTLNAIEEAAKAAIAELKQLGEVMSPERMAELVVGINQAAATARRKSLADFIQDQAKKEGLEISVDARTIDLFERLIDTLEMTPAGLMRASDLKAGPGVVNPGAVFKDPESGASISDAGEWLKSLIRKSEGNGVPGKPWQAYSDQGGVLTIGYGHTNATGTYKFGAGDVIDERIAERILDMDVGIFEKIVDRRVQVPITEAMRAALLHYLYNVGEGNANRDGVFDRLNAGDYAAAQEAIRNGTHTVKGVPNAGLKRRREDEANIFGSQGLDPAAIYRGDAIRAQQATGQVAMPFTRDQLELTTRLQEIVPDLATAANARLTDAVLVKPELLDDARFRSALSDSDISGIAQILRESGLADIANDFATAARFDAQKGRDEKLDKAITDFNKSLKERGELSSKDLTKPTERAIAIEEEVDRVLRGVKESGMTLEQLTGLTQDKAMEDIRRAVAIQADLEQAKQAREAAEKARKAEKEFSQDTADAIRDAEHSVRLAELNATLEEARRLGDVAGQAAAAHELALAKVNKDIEDRERKSGLTVSQSDRDAMLRAAEAELNIEQRKTAQTMEQERLEHRISMLQSQRAFLKTQMEEAEEANDNGRLKELRGEIAAIEQQLLSASDAATEFYKQLGGYASETAIQAQKELRHEIESSDEATKKYRDGVKAIGDVISGHISTAFQDMAKNIAAGKNAFASLGVAVSQAVGNILMDLGMMIMRAVIAKAVLAALGIVAPQGSIMGTAIASLGTGGTGLEQWFGGVHHDGGLVGDTKGEGLSGVIKRLIGLKSNERVTVLETGEEILTAADPRHRGNLTGSLRGFFAKYHSGGIAGSLPDAPFGGDSFAGKTMGAISGALSSAGGGATKIVNAFDGTSFLNEALSSADGERVVMNHVSANRNKWRAALGV